MEIYRVYLFNFMKVYKYCYKKQVTFKIFFKK